MLIKVTERCAARCSHCLEDALPEGDDMTEETFLQALRWTAMVEQGAWLLGVPRKILLSGGEPTEHPSIVDFISIVVREKLVPVLISNGSFLANQELRDAILRPAWRSLMVQVTHDPRYYPNEAPVRVEDERIHYVESINRLIPLGRYKVLDRPKLGETIRYAPGSFNLRSFTHSLGDFSAAVCMQRLRAAGGLSGNCTPSVTVHGDVLLGESRFCWKVGTIRSSNDELTKATIGMGSCNRCGLETNLGQDEKRAIGLSALYGPGDFVRRVGA